MSDPLHVNVGSKESGVLVSVLDSTRLMTSCLTHGRYSTNTPGGEDRREGGSEEGEGRKGRREGRQQRPQVETKAARSEQDRGSKGRQELPDHRRRAHSSTAGVIRGRGQLRQQARGPPTLKSARSLRAARGPQLEDLRPPLLTCRRTLRLVYTPSICRRKKQGEAL